MYICKIWKKGYWCYYQGENPLKCTTHDEKGLVLNAVIFYLTFWSPYKIMTQILSNFSKGLYFKPL